MLARFGKNPWGEQVYRVVWAESRSELLGALWAEGPGYRHVAVYPGIKRWILEKWLPPDQAGYFFAMWHKQGRDEHSGLMQQFPYRGVYECVRVLETPKTRKFMPLSPGFMDFVCRLVEKSRKLTPWERYVAHREAQERKAAEAKRIRTDRVGDVISAFAGTQASYQGQQHRGGFKSEINPNPRPYTGFRQVGPRLQGRKNHVN